MSVDAAVVVRVDAAVVVDSTDPDDASGGSDDDGESSDAASDVADSFGFAGVRRERNAGASTSAPAPTTSVAPSSTMSVDALLEEIDAMGL